MSNPRIGQAKMMCSMWHLLTFHDVSSGVVCFLFPRPPRLHRFEFGLNDGKLLGRRQMPLEDQWLGAFLCCKLHMGGLRRILLNPQLRQRGWILSPATSYKKIATLHLKRYGSCHRIFTLIHCRWYGCSGWYANLPSSPRWERGWFLFFFFPPWLQCSCMLIVVKTHTKTHPSPGSPLVNCLRQARYCYFSGAWRPEGWFPFRSLLKADLGSGTVTNWDAGDGTRP